MEKLHSKISRFILENYKIRSPTDTEYGLILMEKNIKDNGQMEKKMVQEFILIQMADNSQAILLMG